MKINLFQKTFAYTFGMMLMITVLAHALIFLIAPSQNVLITSTLISNVGATTFSEVDMSQLITQTILKTVLFSAIFKRNYNACFVNYEICSSNVKVGC